jgi:hypothetical protein
MSGYGRLAAELGASHRRDEPDQTWWHERVLQPQADAYAGQMNRPSSPWLPVTPDANGSGMVIDPATQPWNSLPQEMGEDGSLPPQVPPELLRELMLQELMKVPQPPQGWGPKLDLDPDFGPMR